MENKLLTLFLIISMIALLVISCGKDKSPDEPVDNSSNINKDKIVLLEETTGKIEKALSAGDQAAFLGFISPTYEKYYKDAVQKNASKLAQFADVFKTRKLQTSDGSYAVYQVQYDGKLFEITMVLDEDGKWKLKDL